MADPEKQPPPYSESAPAPQTQSAGTVTLNISYVKSPRGIIKIVEIFLLMIAFSCMADVDCSDDCGERRSFFLFSTVVPWLICIVIFILYLFCLVEKIPQLNWPLTVMLNAIIWAITILISSSLIADVISGTVSRWFSSGWRSRRIYNNLCAAAVFGFFSIIAFIVDIFFHYQLVRS